MIVILGLIILVAALVVGVAGVLSNEGSAHALNHGFTMLGYHVTGSAGTFFLYGIVVGAAGLLGLSLLLGGARRTSRRGSAARRDLRHSRRETVAASQERDDLIGQRDTARGDTAGTLADGTPQGGRHLTPGNGLRSRMRALGRPSASRPAAAADPEPQTSPAAEVPVTADDSVVVVSRP